VAPVAAELQPRTLVVHGETDDVVPLASVLDWARPQSLPVTVVPGVGHFFHGQLPLLKNIVLHHLHAAP
jgi:alpha/beta superfamily hydrolase